MAMPKFTFFGATCRLCGVEKPILDHWYGIVGFNVPLDTL